MDSNTEVDNPLVLAKPSEPLIHQNQKDSEVEEDATVVEANDVGTIGISSSDGESNDAPAINDSKIESKQSTTNVNQQISSPALHQMSSPALEDKVKNWGKFGLDKNLENGLLVLLPGEKVVNTWSFQSTKLSLDEWIATFLTFGVYYVITRIILKRKRFYKIIVTNMGVTIKEEMSESWCFAYHKLMENQATFPLNTLTYVCCEEMGAKAFGLIPKSVVLEMRFGRYPFSSELPATAYRTIVAMMFDPFVTATNYAFKHAFGINFDDPPVVLVMSIAKAVPLMANPAHWLIFAGFFGVSLLIQLAKWVWNLMKTALLDPSVGPRQVIGQKDARQFRVYAHIVEDPNCVETMRSIVRNIVNQLPDRQVVLPDVQPRLKGSIVRVGISEKPRQINNKKKYKDGDQYVVLEDQFHLPTEEILYDVCPMNPRITFSDYRRLICSLGMYYCTDMAGHISHRKNMYFTNKRLIQHSVLVGSNGEIEHSRLDFWVVDRFTNVAAIEFRRKRTLYASAFNFGWITFDVDIQNPFMNFIFRSLFRPTFEPAKGLGLTGMTADDWRGKYAESARVTAATLKPTENIDVGVKSDQRVFSCFWKVINCFMHRQPKAIVTATDEGLYIEAYTRPVCRPQTRTFILLPWCDVDGIFWQNFDTAGPDCFQSYILSCMCPAIFGYSGCCCCCFNPNGAQQNNKFYYDPLFGHKGSTVAVCARGDSSFRLNFVIPSRYYGVGDAEINALVDSINYRAMKGDRLRKQFARVTSYSNPTLFGPNQIPYATTPNVVMPPSDAINPLANMSNSMRSLVQPLVSPIAPSLAAQPPQFANSTGYYSPQPVTPTGPSGVVVISPQTSSQKLNQPVATSHYATVSAVVPPPNVTAAPPAQDNKMEEKNGPIAVVSAVLPPPAQENAVLAQSISSKSIDGQLVTGEASAVEAVAAAVPSAPTAQPVVYGAVSAITPPQPPPPVQIATVLAVTGPKHDPSRAIQSSLNSSSSNPGGVLTAGQGAVSNAALSMINGGTSINYSTTQPLEIPNEFTTTTVSGYRSPNARSFGSTKVGFPMTFDMNSGIANLAPGERLLKSWKVETTQLEWWEILYILLSFGTYLIYHMMFYQTRRFYNIYVTTDRVFIKEEIFSLTGCVIQLIYENQASFKLVDLCYIGSQDSGPRGLFCCLPPLTQLEIRFGRYPLPSQIPKSLAPASPSSSNINIFMKAYLKAVEKVYGLTLSGAPHLVAEAQMAHEQHPHSVTQYLLDIAILIPQVFIEFFKILMDMFVQFLIHLFFNDEHSTGPEQLKGEEDARSFVFTFKTANAGYMAAEIIQCLSDTVASRIEAMTIPKDMQPLQMPLFTVAPAPHVEVMNSTDTYGEPGGFCVIEKMWKPLRDEVILDVQPANTPLTCWDYFRVIFDIYALLYLWMKPQFKKSYMLTNRRLISHNLRVYDRVVRYSNLEMWFLVPTNTYTIVQDREKFFFGLCTSKKRYHTFIADSYRFGPINLTLRSDQFIKNILRLTNERKFSEPASDAMSREGFDEVPVLRESTFTRDLFSDREVIDAAVGSVLPKTLLSRMLCKGQTTSSFTFTNKAVYLEVFSKNRRILLCVPWYEVRGLYWSNFQSQAPCCNGPTKSHGLHGYDGSQVRINLRGRGIFSGVALPGRYYGGKDDDEITETVDKLFRRFKKVTAKVSFNPDHAPWI